MEGLFAFFSFQNIVNIFVILGGVSAFIIYATQRRASVKSAFTMVINQIDGIEEVISKLRSTQADGKLCNEEVFKSDQILSRNFWSEYKHLIMRQLDQTDIKILDEIFCENWQNPVKQRITPHFLTTSPSNYYEFTTKE